MRLQQCIALISISIILLILCANVSGGNDFFSRNMTADAATDVKPFYGCETSAYPPNPSSRVPTYTIDLALQPRQRWTALVLQKKQELLALVGHVANFTQSLIGERAFNILINNLDGLTASLPSPYREEMAGIAEASGLSAAKVTLYNIFYELFTFCTSIVAQDPQGRIFHGRNLDFGLFLGWNSSSHQWRVTQLLKPLVLQVDWLRGDTTLYSSVHYLGYVGVVTAVKKGVFSFSVNERFSWNGGYVGLLEWILLKDHKQQWLAFLSRDLMEAATTYDQAKHMLMKPRLLAPVYFILAGTAPGQGCIITRDRDDHKVLDLGSPDYVAKWFLVQTNYDHWDAPPAFDDRRTPAISCLMAANRTQQYHAAPDDEGLDMLNAIGGLDSSSGDGERNETLSLLFNVLSTRPVLNKLTTYTTLMSAGDGSIASWLQHCADPCWPW